MATKKDGASQLMAKITEMTDADRAIAEPLHEAIMAAAPYAVTRVTAADAKKITALVKKAVS